MRVSILQENLLNVITTVLPVVEARPSLPVLANVLLEAGEGKLKITGTCLSQTITYTTKAMVDEPGAFTVPAKTFLDLVKTLSRERVDMVLEDDTEKLHIRCGRTKSSIKGIPADQFPAVEHDGRKVVKITGDLFQQMIRDTIFAAAKEHNRPILTGILMRFEPGCLTMAGADGYRMSIRKATVDSSEELNFVVPAKALKDISKSLTDGEISIALTPQEDKATFSFGNVEMTTQLLEGRFPDVESVATRHKPKTTTNLDTSAFLKACRTAHIFARDNANSGRIYITPSARPGEPGEVKVLGKSAERGDINVMLDALVQGDAIDISFNLEFLHDVLSVIGDEKVLLETSGSVNPGIVRRAENHDYIHVIMPMG